MKEKGILFQGDMVRAILAGTKTQTRRPLYVLTKNVNKAALLTGGAATGHAYEKFIYQPPCSFNDLDKAYTVSDWQKAKPGDRLWVRETWGVLFGNPHDREDPTWWRADYAPGELDRQAAPERWRPSIHMPRYRSRITLEVTGMRIERLAAISVADALAEGIDHKTMNDPRVEYQHLWERINGPGSWDANPWVVAISFKRVP